MSPVVRPPPATAADIAERANHERLEIVHGQIVHKASPSWNHAGSQVALIAWLKRHFDRRTGGRSPGGWHIRSECDVEYGPHDLFRHDLSGWHRERVTEQPKKWPVRIRPDWACEILSESNAKRDLVDKSLVLHRYGVPHYWILDPEEKLLLVYRHGERGYMNILSATSGERVRAEPFEAVELRGAILFVDEDDDE
jgi:Uma2 family endonuclease